MEKPSTDQNMLWSHFQNERKYAFEGAKPRLDFILNRIRVKHKKSRAPVVLNIGAGDGYLDKRAKAQGWKIYALDPDSQTIERLSCMGVSAFKGYIEHMPLPSLNFDFVVASEVLEHLPAKKRQVGLGEVARVLKPAGWFLGTVPHNENLMFNQVLCPKCGEVFHRWGHKTSFDVNQIHEELSLLFVPIRVHTRAFVDHGRQGIGNKLKNLIRFVMGRFGFSIAMPNIYFEARNRGI